MAGHGLRSTLAALGIGAALAACGGDGPPTATPASGGGTPVPVEMRNFAYVPNPVTVKAGEPIEFRLRSRDIEHTFTVRQLSIDWSVAGGRSAKRTFTFTAPGDYRIICTVPGHEAAGMVGTLIVR